MLIKGLPGTGKTQTLVTLIRILTLLNKSVLITSHTNSAVDNILLRLMEHDVNFMRLGSAQRIHEKLKKFRESSMTENCKNAEDLQKVYDEVQVVAVTCLGSGHQLLTRRKFDYCLVDEATQIFQPTVIRALLSAEKFVLVGDPQQLAPLVKSAVPGGGESLFERLDTPQSTMLLGLQYRMNRVITRLANNLTYGGDLKCGNEKVEKAVMAMTVPTADKWLAKALSPHIDMSCALIDTGDVSSFTENPHVNPAEAAIVLRVISLLSDAGFPLNVIGVIAPYRGQVDALRKILPGVEVNTVDQYQGRDKEIIVYSCTQSGAREGKGAEILEDRRRLTVAITRAKHKLIMVGDVKRLGEYAPFADLFKHLPGIAKVKVEDGKFGFDWKSLMEKVL
jgi:DNA replication ATP-dependent helicase Dna2